MREVGSVFEDGFKVGLRPEQTVRTTIEHLTRCYNMVPTPLGLRSREIPINPLPDTVPEFFPWPALYILSRYILLFTSSACYKVNQDWELELVTSGLWEDLPHIADFIDTVVWSTPTGQWCLSDKGIQSVIAPNVFTTCCNFRGQLVSGNFYNPHGGPSWSPNPADGRMVSENTPIGGDKNWVAWSAIGALDWRYDGNEAGFAPMPWLGEVHAMLPLAKEVVVYGDNGVVKLSPESTPAITFGVQDYGDIGILNRNCVAGDFLSHLYVGADYELYQVTPEKALSGEGKQPTRLGYKEWISQLTDPVVTFDPSSRHWWIGDSSKCFIYSGSGLGEASVTPTHLNRLNGELYGLAFRNGTDEAIVETGSLNFGSQGIKTLMCVEASLEGGEKVSGSCSWRSIFNRQYSETKRKLLDPRGAFFPVVAGTNIKVKLTARDFTTFAVDKLWLRYKNTDKTFQRGVINAGAPKE